MKFSVATFLTAFVLSVGVSHAEDPATPRMAIGKGEKNWIITEGATRDASTFSFPEVMIDGNGWLVMHPFKDGVPNGKIYVGHTYISDGLNTDVRIDVEPAAKSGDLFIVMLHSDVDEDEVFDFIFVDETHVEDRAIFEGDRMIAHVYSAP